jgi:ubiquitin-conjugating enzyme E2 variant
MQEQDLSNYSPQQRCVEIVAIGAFGALAAWSVVRVGSAASALILVPAAIGGWIVADLLSGLVHWAFDTWGSVHTPFLGPRFIRPFREHHHDPQAMARHDFVETNGASCIGGLPAVIATATMPMQSSAWIAAQALLLFTALGVLATNQCHKWAHQDPDGLHPLIRGAQRLRLVLSAEHHRRHHAAPFDSHYCTTTGWLNGPLERIGLFRMLERWIRQASALR